MSKKTPNHERDPLDEPQEVIDRAEAADEGGPPSVEALLAERDDLLARLQRVSADYLNYQKRQARSAVEAGQFANADLARDLLVVLDDMERALEAALANHDGDDPLLAGMRMVYQTALETLARHGVTPVAAEPGEAFDPQRHEAMMRQPDSDVDSPTIAQQLQRGYELNGRVLRPARVIVAVPVEPESDDEGAQEDD